LWSGAPDSVRCTRVVQEPSSHSQENAGVLHYNSLDCSVSQWGNGYLRAMVDSDSAIVSQQKSEGHRTVRCTTRLSGATRRQRCQRSTAPEP
jgi:hypothetical protein